MSRCKHQKIKKNATHPPPHTQQFEQGLNGIKPVMSIDIKVSQYKEGGHLTAVDG